MRPVRSAIQGIFANQEQLRSERETERRKLESELRAEQRGIEAERRREAAAIRSEDRVRERRREDEKETAIAEAKRLGLSTDGNLREIQGRVTDYKTNVKEPRGYLLANKDVLGKIIPAQVYKQIEGNELSGEELKQLKATYEPTVQANRQSQLAIARKNSPNYLREFEGAKKEYQGLTTRLSEIKGGYLGDSARRSLLSKEENNPLPSEQFKKRGRLTAQDPTIQDLFEEYPRLVDQLNNSPEFLILNQGEIAEGVTLYDESVSSEFRRRLMEAWESAGTKVADQANTTQTQAFWKREADIKLAAELRIGSSEEVSYIRRTLDDLKRQFPDLRNWNAMIGEGGGFAEKKKTPPVNGEGERPMSALEIMQNQSEYNQSTQPQSGGTSTEEGAEDVPVVNLGSDMETPTPEQTAAPQTEPPAPRAAVAPVNTDPMIGINPFMRTALFNMGTTSANKKALARNAELDREITEARRQVGLAGGFRPDFASGKRLQTALDEKRSLLAANPFLNRSQFDIPTSAPVVPPVPETVSNYPTGYEQNVKQVQSQVGQTPPQMGSASPQPYTPQTYMRPQFPPLPPQPLPRNKVRINQGTRALINRPVSEFGEYLKSVFGEEFPTPRYPR